MIIAAARHHIPNIKNDLVGAKKRAIHPSSALFHQHGQALRAIGEGFGIGDVLHGVASVLLDVDLKAHDTILSEVFIGFSASRCLCARHILEEHIKWAALDGLPAEQGVSAWKDGCEAEE